MTIIQMLRACNDGISNEAADVIEAQTKALKEAIERFTAEDVAEWPHSQAHPEAPYYFLWSAIAFAEQDKQP